MNKLNEHNDYTRTTKDWLKRYNQFKATVDNLRDDISALESMLAIEVSAPIAKYGDEPAGGTSELNSIEAAAEKRIDIVHKIDIKKSDIKKIELIIRKIDRAMSSLPVEEQALLRGHYIDYKSWTELAHELYLSERWARNKCNLSLKKLSEILFGNRVIQESLFVFLE